jgi:hypothetical protein
MGWLDKDGKPRAGFKTAAGGAATAVWCATSPLLTAGGVYCEDCNVAEAKPANDNTFTGVRPWAIDPDAARRLWSLSEQILGETFPL